jgi:ABC-2 type transport system permease protein
MSATLPARPAEPQEPPGAPEAAGLVALRQLRSFSRSRRLVVGVILCAFPPVLAWVRAEPSVAELVSLLSAMHLSFLTPLLALFLGTGLLYDEAEEGTLTFLFTSPVSRRAVLLGKWCAAFVAASAVLLVSMGATVLVSKADLSTSGPLLRACFASAFLGLAAYLGLFAFLGTLFRRGFIAGVLYCLAFEVIAYRIPGVIRYVSMRFYMHSLAIHHAPSSLNVSDNLDRLDVATTSTCYATLMGTALVGLALALVIAGHREYQARNVQG